MDAGQAVLTAVIAAGGGAYVRGVAGRVEKKLPPAQRQKTERARAAVAARTAPVTDPVRRAAAKAAPHVRQARDALIAAAGPRAARIAGQFVLRPDAPPAAPDPVPAVPANVVTLDSRRAPAPAPVPFPRPAPVFPEVPVPAPSDVLTPGGAGADLFAAVQHIIGHADAGGVQAKQRALYQMSEALEYLSEALAGFARRLAEPDQGYGASVWEPVAQAAAHVKAAQMQSSEATSALRHVLSLTVGEAASTGTRVPHHEQINSGL